MKFEATESFLADFKRLRTEHKAAFKKVMRHSSRPACDAWARPKLNASPTCGPSPCASTSCVARRA